VLLLLAALGLAGHPTASAGPAIPARPTVEAPAEGWWTEDGAWARVHAAPRDRATARRLADRLATSVPRLAARLGLRAGATMDVYLAPDREAFSRLQPGEPPEWADGTAWPRAGLIFLTAPSARPGTATPLETVLDHEVVHVLLGRAFGERPVPRWLQEGTAQLVAGELGPATADTLARADTLLPISTLAEGFPRDPVLARLAYAESVDLVAWVSRAEGLPNLIRALAEGASLDAAFLAAVGMDIEAADAAWRSRVDKSRLSWLRIAESPLWWAGGAGLLTAGMLRRRLASSPRRARMEAEDRRLQEWEAAAARGMAPVPWWGIAR
jgi:hypothetical protein